MDGTYIKERNPGASLRPTVGNTRILNKASHDRHNEAAPSNGYQGSLTRTTVDGFWKGATTQLATATPLLAAGFARRASANRGWTIKGLKVGHEGNEDREKASNHIKLDKQPGICRWNALVMTIWTKIVGAAQHVPGQESVKLK